MGIFYHNLEQAYLGAVLASPTEILNGNYVCHVDNLRQNPNDLVVYCVLSLEDGYVFDISSGDTFQFSPRTLCNLSDVLEYYEKCLEVSRMRTKRYLEATDRVRELLVSQ